MAIQFTFDNQQQLKLTLEAMLQGWALLLVDKTRTPDQRNKSREELLKAIYNLEQVDKQYKPDKQRILYKR